MTSRLAAAATALALTLAAGTPAAATNTTGYWTDADFQRAELLACKADLGYSGNARLVSQRARGGGVLVRMAPYDRIDASEAAAINACADRRNAQARLVTDRLLRSTRGCYRGASLMYRGNQYCFKNR